MKFAVQNGYNVEVIKGYTFDKQDRVFDKYIDHIYKLKSTTTNKSLRAVSKSLLNNLLGRFGIDIEKAKTVIVDKDTFQTMATMYKFKGYKELSDNKYLLSYIPKLDKEIIESHNLYIVEFTKKYKDR